MVDQFGQEVSGTGEAVATWNRCVLDLLGMRGDPIAGLDEASARDAEFVMGPVFTGSYRILGAGIPTGKEISTDLRRAHERSAGATKQERAHVAAFETLVLGDFSEAASQWGQIVRDHPQDVVAARIAHDIYLHVGNIEDRLLSSENALQAWKVGEPGYGWLLGNYSFALEEAGRYAEAERAGLAALEENPTDCWALHSLAHVYEHMDAQDTAILLLRSNQNWWSKSDLLAGHIWWHLALRLIESRDYEEVFAIADEQMADGVTPFRLADATSLLWRLELDGQDVGGRWHVLIERWKGLEQLHTSAFIDMHAAMAFASTGSTPEGDRFWSRTLNPHYGHSENGELMRGTVVGLASTLRSYRSGGAASCEEGFRRIERNLQSIGGSLAQREVLTRTRVKNLMESDAEAAASYLTTLAVDEPTRVWIKRDLERIQARILNNPVRDNPDGSIG